MSECLYMAQFICAQATIKVLQRIQDNAVTELKVEIVTLPRKVYLVRRRIKKRRAYLEYLVNHTTKEINRLSKITVKGAPETEDVNTTQVDILTEARNDVGIVYMNFIMGMECAGTRWRSIQEMLRAEGADEAYRRIDKLLKKVTPEANR